MSNERADFVGFTLMGDIDPDTGEQLHVDRAVDVSEFSQVSETSILIAYTTTSIGERVHVMSESHKVLAQWAEIMVGELRLEGRIAVNDLLFAARRVEINPDLLAEMILTHASEEYRLE